MKVIKLMIVALLLASCSKEEMCSNSYTVEYIDNSDHPGNISVEGEGGTVSVMVQNHLLYTYDNGNAYIVGIVNEEYKLVEGLNECDLVETLKEARQ